MSYLAGSEKPGVRWFKSSIFANLIVWGNARLSDGQGGSVFQIGKNRVPRDKAVSHRNRHGFSHDLVEDSKIVAPRLKN